MTTARKRIEATKHDADFVVERGLATKNRFGVSQGPVDLPDGCYVLMRLDEPPQELLASVARAMTYAAAVARKKAKR